VLIAARESVSLDVGALSTNVDWPGFAAGLQRLGDALAALEKDGAGIAGSIKVKPLLAPRKP
jgi:hypothetical protein